MATNSFYSRTRSSAAGRLIRSAPSPDQVGRKRSHELTPVRPFKSSKRSDNNCYSPGMALEDGGFSESDSELAREDERHAFTPFETTRFVANSHEVVPDCGSHAMHQAPSGHLERSGGCGVGNYDMVISMLQQQQMLLQTVVNGQKTLEQRQNDIEEKLASSLQERIAVSPASSLSSNDGKRKRVVTRALSVSLNRNIFSVSQYNNIFLFQNKVYSIHKELEKQFNGSEP